MTESSAPLRMPNPVLLGLTAVAALVGAGAVALWVHYGSTVFFEMIRAGFIACFG